MNEEKQLAVEEGGQQLAPLEEEQVPDYTVPVILFFGGSVPMVMLSQVLGLGMPGFVAGAVLAGILAATGKPLLSRLSGLFPGLEQYRHLDWTVLLRPLDDEGNVVDADEVSEQGQPKDAPREDEPQAATQAEPVAEPVASESIEFARRQAYEVPGMRRITVDEIIKHTVLNSYCTYIGRSLTQPNYPAVPVNFYRRHIKLIGASTKGKSSMAAALLEAITRTHDPEHVLVALLDKEDKTSKLFAGIPHLAELVIGDRPVVLHARDADQVLEHLEHIVGLLKYRYTLSSQEVALEPLLIVYLEEFLSLKDDFKHRIDATSGEAKDKAKKEYARLVYCIKEIARRGLKVNIQFLLCAQADYSDDDLQEALINVTSGMCFCVRASTALSAGFYQTDLLNRNAKDNQFGQAVAEMPDVRDLILAPEYDLEKRLIAWEKAEAAHNPRPAIRTARQSPVAAAGSHKRRGPVALAEDEVDALLDEMRDMPDIDADDSRYGRDLGSSGEVPANGTETYSELNLSDHSHVGKFPQALPKNGASELVEGAEDIPEAFQPGKEDLLLSELQAELLIVFYRNCGSISKSLEQIKNDKAQGLGARYNKHASYILDVRGLKKVKRA